MLLFCETRKNVIKENMFYIVMSNLHEHTSPWNSSVMCPQNSV